MSLPPGPLNQLRSFGFTRPFLQFRGLGNLVAATTGSSGPYNAPIIFDFTRQFASFRSPLLGFGPSPPPPPTTSVDQFLIGGPGITEQFVTFGGISAMGLSYIINPLSRKTVGGTSVSPPPPPPPPPPTNTFDPANTSDATFAALSNGNRTYTETSGAFDVAVARSIASVTAGKRYVEFSMDSIPGPNEGSCVPGMGDGTVFSGTGSPALFAWLGFNASMGMLSNPSLIQSRLFMNGAIAVTWPSAFVTGDIISFAVNVATKLAWVRINSGNWNNNVAANPATGVGGVAFGTDIPGSPLYAYGQVFGDIGTALTVTLTAPFTLTVPTGFTGWGA